MQQDIIQEFIREAEEMGIAVSGEQAAQFDRYADMLVDWNERVNLTRITEPQAICRGHFLDSIQPVRFTELAGRSLIDIGTGAGFPGIPLKIMVPELSLTLLDALEKRCDFLRAVVSELRLDRPDAPVKILHGRAEDYASAATPDSLRGQFDHATSRAVAKLNILCEYAVPFLKTGGQFIAYKLDDGGEELAQAAHAMEVLGAACDRTETYSLPDTEPERALYFIRAVSPTPGKYPRRAGVPGKKPL